MSSWAGWAKQASLNSAETWRLRRRTLRAMVALGRAQMEVSFVPMRVWRNSVGLEGQASSEELAEARRLARHVERAAMRLPFRTKCLPQAIALSRMLRRQAIAHEIVLAVRPAQLRQEEDSLHAWLEVAEEILLGNLPGPWHETARLSG